MVADLGQRRDQFRTSPRAYTSLKGWHNESRRQYLIVLSGQMEITVGDGTARVLRPGDVLLAEDLTGQGHIVRNLEDKPFVRVTIPAGEE